MGRKVTCEAYADRGIVGPRGKSAYEQAVEGGYTGTEEDFEAALASDINTVAGSISDVNTVGANISDVNTVAGISSDVSTVAGVASDISTVAGINADISAVASNSSNINTVSGNSTNINTVATNISNINAVAADLTNIDNASTYANNAANSATNAATSATNAQTWAEGTDAQVAALGGTKSSKGWAARAQEIAESIGAIYKPAGSVAFASLPALSADVLGNVYNITDAFTTTADFVEGAGNNYPAGTNVAIVDIGTEGSHSYKFDVLSGFVDLSAYRTAAAQDVIDGNLSSSITTHTNNIDNPHGVTKEQIGLGNVDNTSDVNKPISIATQQALNAKQNTISDIETIRSGATAGSSAVQPTEMEDVFRESNLIPAQPVAFVLPELANYYTINGSPTIVNKIASGFSSSDYLQLQKNLPALTTTNNWEMGSKIITPASGDGIILGITTWYLNGFRYANNGKKVVAQFYNYANSAYVEVSSGTLSPNTAYYIKTYCSGTNLVLAVSTDKRTWTEYTTALSSNFTTNPTDYHVHLIGGGGNYGTFGGSIDLNETYIKFDNDYFLPKLEATLLKVNDMTGATSSVAGSSGLVPAPAVADRNKFLKGDGTWDNPAGGGGSSRNVGEIVESTVPLTDAGLHLLDGSLLSGSGSYADFVTHMAGVYADHPELFATEADWQTSVTNYGVCGKFVYDSVNNTVRLPKKSSTERHLVKSVHNGEAWCDIYSDGWCEQGNSREAMSQGSIKAIDLIVPFVDTSYNVLNISLASGITGNARSNPMLGTNRTTSGFNLGQDTYTDQGGIWEAKGFVDVSDLGSETTYQYIVIANSTKTEIEVDIDEIATDLNGKADVDLSNVSNTSGFRKLVEVYNNGTSWYKVYREYNPSTGTFIGKWCEQGGTYYKGSSISGDNTINFLKQFANTNYNFIAFPIHSTANSNGYTFYEKYPSRTTSSTVLHGPSALFGYSWEAKGYIN